LSDTKSMTVGEKRNHLVDTASGKYVAFVDDDDRLEPDYLKSLVIASYVDLDVITFKVSVSINSGPAKMCVYSKSFRKDYNTTDEYRRLPNHLMATKKELVRQVRFKETNFGEDSDYATRLKPLLKTEFAIPKVLYHYEYNDETSETRRG
jgi:glycosyltransferase involved in cell wall biosynthesis